MRDSKGYDSEAERFFPYDLSPERCQCVRSHNGDMKDGKLAQCDMRRSRISNLFCDGCEALHGDLARKEMAAAEM